MAATYGATLHVARLLIFARTIIIATITRTTTIVPTRSTPELVQNSKPCTNPNTTGQKVRVRDDAIEIEASKLRDIKPQTQVTYERRECGLDKGTTTMDGEQFAMLQIVHGMKCIASVIHNCKSRRDDEAARWGLVYPLGELITYLTKEVQPLSSGITFSNMWRYVEGYRAADGRIGRQLDMHRARDHGYINCADRVLTTCNLNCVMLHQARQPSLVY